MLNNLHLYISIFIMIISAVKIIILPLFIFLPPHSGDVTVHVLPLTNQRPAPTARPFPPDDCQRRAARVAACGREGRGLVSMRPIVRDM